MRIPTFSRQSGTDTTNDDRPTVAGGSTVGRPDDRTTTRFTTAGGPADTRAAGAQSNRAEATADRAEAKADRAMAGQGRAAVTSRDPDATREHRPVRDPEPAGPKPRASLLATLGLILGVTAALLVLSGPLLGYGIGVAALALILSVAGLRATGRRHVAGKTDALIGMVLSLAAIVVGVLALTGSLSWLGTDMQPVTSAREWLDAQFVNRF
ncbi:MAG TPA: hypothetical protein VFH03_23435 [Actinoplanes sp.]|nr:hypothetical protein [Actinoplanes sp.]